MIELPPLHADVRPWIVCEPESRWLTALRRFAPDLMPPPLTCSIVAKEATQVRGALVGHPRAVVWWEVRRQDLLRLCDSITQVAIASPGVLQIASCATLSRRERWVLAELRVHTAVRHIEDIPKLARLVQGYFAPRPQDLD